MATLSLFAVGALDGTWSISKSLGAESVPRPSSQPATTARYAHLADDPVKAVSEAVGRQIASAMDGGTSGEVVVLKRG
jgi:hypothetical protein